MKKLFLSFLLLFFALAVNASTVKIDGIYYNLNSKVKIAEVTFGDELYYGEVNIPEKIEYEGVEYSVTSIGDWAFNHQGDASYVYYHSGLSKVTIPNSVKTIGKYVFRGCTGLSSVTLGNSLTSIGNSAFRLCRSLSYLKIPDSVTEIGSTCFYDCSNLSSVIIGGSLTTAGTFIFGNCTNLTFVDLGNSMAIIPGNAFHNCTNLKSVNIPNSVKIIGGAAFNGCTNLNQITIGNCVTEIGASAFRGCSSLTNVTIPNSVSTIYDSAFDGCSNLKILTIGYGIKSIAENAFANCRDLTDVYCSAEDVPITNTDAFKDSYIEFATLHVPVSALEEYKNSLPWMNFKEKIALEGDDIPETKKCATPEICYSSGKVSLSCETEGVDFISKVTVEDAKDYYESEFTLTQTYKITVYATKVGYENSDVATASLCWIDAEPKTEGITNSFASVRALAVLIQSNGNQLTISGADDGTFIYVYDTSGKQVGSSKASAESTTINTSLRSGEIGIVKIGDKSVKVLLK